MTSGSSAALLFAVLRLSAIVSSCQMSLAKLKLPNDCRMMNATRTFSCWSNAHILAHILALLPLMHKAMRKCDHVHDMHDHDKWGRLWNACIKVIVLRKPSPCTTTNHTINFQQVFKETYPLVCHVTTRAAHASGHRLQSAGHAPSFDPDALHQSGAVPKWSCQEQGRAWGD